MMRKILRRRPATRCLRKSRKVVGRRVEPLRELVGEPGPPREGDSAVDMSRLAHAEGRHTWLLADPSPGAVQRAVEPEARLVAVTVRSDPS